MTQSIKTAFLIDKDNKVIAELSELNFSNGLCSGKIKNINMPEDLVQLFNLHEQLANDQILSAIDGVADKIAHYRLRVDILTSAVYDVQVIAEDISCRY